MFTATTFYRICIALVGAVSVRGECWITPNENGRVVIPEDTLTIPARVSTNELLLISLISSPFQTATYIPIAFPFIGIL